MGSRAVDRIVGWPVQLIIAIAFLIRRDTAFLEMDRLIFFSPVT